MLSGCLVSEAEIYDRMLEKLHVRSHFFDKNRNHPFQVQKPPLSSRGQIFMALRAGYRSLDKRSFAMTSWPFRHTIWKQRAATTGGKPIAGEQSILTRLPLPPVENSNFFSCRLTLQQPSKDW
jgi:hypothetical protein